MPAYWRLRSLRLRLLLAMLGVALSAIGLSAGISGWQQYQATLASNQSELAALAELLGNRSAAALAFGDAQLAEENVAALAGLPQIAKGCLYDGTDQLLAGFARPGSGLRCPSRSRDTEASPMRVVRPVLANGAEVGHVLLHFDASLLAQRQREQLLNATIALLLAIFPAMGLALLLQRRITRPLALVREVAEAVVAKRDFNLRAPVPRDDEIGSLAHSFNSMLDTLQAQARQLEAESAYNSLLFRDSPIPIVLADRKSGLIVDCNDAAVAAYGRSSREAVIGLTPADVSAPIQYDGRPSQEHFPEAYGDLQRTGSRTFEWLHRRADGSTWDAEIHMRSFLLHDRPHALLSIIDVTERRLAQAQLARLNLELEARVEARTAELRQTLETLQRAQQELLRSERLASLGSLVAGVAHELNTPLGNMLVVASTFADAVTPVRDGLADGSLKRSALEAFLEESEHMAALLLRNGERAAELIRQFKQVAVDQTSEGRRRYELGATLREVLRTLQPQFRNSALRIQLEAADDLGMDGYPGAISQILTNLVLNAQAHAFEGRDGGCVRISAEADGETGVRLVVADDGRGIPAEVLPRIFDPFFTTKFGQGGSGLGLHIVWVLATDRLGGQIHVESTVGSGTRFVLHLPRTAPHPVAESAEGPPPAA